MKAHWMKFYPADWQADIQLRSCSFAARGLWVELICIMQKSRGYLLVNGKPPANSLLAILCGGNERDIAKLLKELEAAGVFSRTEDGVIFSRRILRDIERAETDKANGAKGGNPWVKGGVNPPVNPNDKGGDKAQKLEARIQNKPSEIEDKGTGSFDKREPREVGDLRSRGLAVVVGGGQ